MASTSKALAGIDGSKKDFPFDFPYQKKTDIKVELIHATHGATVLDSTKFTPFKSATEIEFNGDGLTDPSNWQAADGAPLSGVTGRVYRDTDSSKLAATFYPGSAIRSSDLNDNYEQNLYVTQESENDATDALNNSRALESGVYETAIDKAIAAVATAGGAKDDADDALEATDALVGKKNEAGVWVTRGHATTDGSDDESGVGKALDDSLEAKNTANNAKDIADAADEIADKALDATDTLVATKSGSTWTLQGDGVGSNPKGVKYAVEEAEDAVSTANDAALDATTALSNSRNTADPPVSAISIAEDAKATALAAQTSVANSTTWTQKDDKATFEGLTFAADTEGEPSQKSWEITNSTGISSSYTGFTDGGGTAKTVIGVPSDFTGDSGLSARFTYEHSENKFTWSGYWVNDAETRYVVLAPATGTAPQSQSVTAANLPSGTTAQQPANAVAGMFRYNTEESEFEGYDGTEWGKVGGGLVTIDGGDFTLGDSLVHTTESYDGGSFN